TPDVSRGAFHIQQRVNDSRKGLKVRATLRDEKGVVAAIEDFTNCDLSISLKLKIPAERRRLWSPRDPHLYDIDFELLDEDGNVLDHAKSYAGLRGVVIDGQAVKINGEVIFQRLVLDQGYYPDG